MNDYELHDMTFNTRCGRMHFHSVVHGYVWEIGGIKFFYEIDSWAVYDLSLKKYADYKMLFWDKSLSVFKGSSTHNHIKYAVV